MKMKKVSILDSFTPALVAGLVLAALAPAGARAQLLRKSDFGVGVTVAIYQFDDARSREIQQITALKQTVSTPQEEVDLITRSLGAEDLKFRYVRTVGLREGEPFTDTQPMNDRPFSFTITPKIITRDEVTFEFAVRFDGKPLLELKSVTANNYETVVLKGGRGAFGLREFTGPSGAEKAPETRALLVTITPSIASAKTLQNKPSDISRPTDQFGSRVELGESDIFDMPALVSRAPLKFPPGSSPKGSITLQAIITPDGSVTNVRVLDTPDPALNPKAIEAFRQYRFNPAKLNGKPTYATYRETIQLGKQGPL